MSHKSHKEKSLAELCLDCKSLQDSKQTLLLSTRNIAGDPEISYAPYVRDERGIYVFISELAGHTRNMRQHKRAAIMFIADEGQSRNPFARERLTYQCQVIEISKEDNLHAKGLAALEAKFGNTMSLLKTLPDFYLFRLEPYKGSYVIGFGRAYEVEPKSGQLKHISADVLQQK